MPKKLFFFGRQETKPAPAATAPAPAPAPIPAPVPLPVPAQQHRERIRRVVSLTEASWNPSRSSVQGHTLLASLIAEEQHTLLNADKRSDSWGASANAGRDATGRWKPSASEAAAARLTIPEDSQIASLDGVAPGHAMPAQRSTSAQHEASFPPFNAPFSWEALDQAAEIARLKRLVAALTAREAALAAEVASLRNKADRAVELQQQLSHLQSQLKQVEDVVIPELQCRLASSDSSPQVNRGQTSGPETPEHQLLDRVKHYEEEIVPGLQAEVFRKDGELAVYQGQIAAANHHIQDLEGELRQATEVTVPELKRDLTEKERQVEMHGADLAKLQKKLQLDTEYRTRMGELQNQLRVFQTRLLQAGEGRTDVAVETDAACTGREEDLEKELQNLKVELGSAEEQCAKLKPLEGRVIELEGELLRVKNVVVELEEEKERLAAKVVELTRQIQTLQSGVEQSRDTQEHEGQAKLAEAALERASGGQQADADVEELAAVKEQLAEKERELQALQQRLKHAEGAVMQQLQVGRGWNGGEPKGAQGAKETSAGVESDSSSRQFEECQLQLIKAKEVVLSRLEAKGGRGAKGPASAAYRKCLTELDEILNGFEGDASLAGEDPADVEASSREVCRAGGDSESEAGDVSGQDFQHQVAWVPRSTSMSDTEKAGVLLMKHFVTVEALQKEHELERKLARREMLNLQNELEQMKASMEERLQENQALKKDLAQMAQQLKEQTAKLAKQAAERAVEPCPKDQAAAIESKGLSENVKKQLVFGQLDSPASSPRGSPMGPAAVKRAASQRVRAAALAIIQQQQQQ